MNTIITVLSTSLFALTMVGVALASPKALLDGQKYAGMVTPAGKDKGDADTISFENGLFHSSACDQYGFKPSSYTAKKDGEVVRFETVAKNAEGVTNSWSGTIKGNVIEGKLVWSKGDKTMEFKLEGKKA